jgi:hypothetical protein
MEREHKQPLRVQIDRCAARRDESGLEIEVTVRNEESRPIFATVGVRQIQLDPSTGRLDLWFSDHGRDTTADGGRCRMNSVPETRTIESGQSMSFTVRLLPTYTRVVPHADQSFHFESIDMGQARTVVAHIGVADTPFYYNPRRGAMIEQLVTWGEARTATSTIPRETHDAE